MVHGTYMYISLNTVLIASVNVQFLHRRIWESRNQIKRLYSLKYFWYKLQVALWIQQKDQEEDRQSIIYNFHKKFTVYKETRVATLAKMV